MKASAAEGPPATDPRRVANLAASVVLRAYADGVDRRPRQHAMPAVVQEGSKHYAQQVQGVLEQAAHTR